MNKNSKDVFKITELKKIMIDNNYYQFPKPKYCNKIPNKIISFNYAMTCKKPDDYWIHFYIDDYQFERVFNNLEKYYKILKKFRGIIEPDFSLYSNLPRIRQIYSIYKNRFVASYMSMKGIDVIPNVTWSDIDSLNYSLNSIPKNNVISLSTNGVTRTQELKDEFIQMYDIVTQQLQPSKIIIVGSLFDKLLYDKRILRFDSHNNIRVKNY